MKKIILLSIAFLAFLFSNAQGVITVQRATTTIFESTLDSAIAHAQQGDVIYLPAGNFYGSLPIHHKVSIIGCGYNIDSCAATGITIIHGYLNFDLGSDSSFLTGAKVDYVMLLTPSCFVNRCRIQSLQPTANSLSITENVIDDINTQSSTNYSNGRLGNNIFFNQINNLWGYAVENNIFIGNANFGQNSNCSFINNIFAGSNINIVGSNFYSNNLFEFDSATVSSAGITSNNSVFAEPFNNIFSNVPAGTGILWSPSYNFHLKPGCNGIGLGTGGTEVGIYGGANPWKEGGKPFNPHFQAIQISNGTGANGTLNIDIKVEAQDR